MVKLDSDGEEGSASARDTGLPLLVSCVAAALLTSACATGYQPNGLTGGFEEARVNSNSFRVTFRGNGYTSTNRAEELTLLRSAEICLENGYPGFVLLRERTAVQNDSVWVSNTTFNRGNFFTSGSNLTFSAPSTSNLVSCIHEKPANAFTYEALVIYDGLTKKYEVPRSNKFPEWQANLAQVQVPAPTPSAAPIRASAVPQSFNYLSTASRYAQSVACSAKPVRTSMSLEGAEQYEFLCPAGKPPLQIECHSDFVAASCRHYQQ